MKVLDHGYVNLIGTLGTEESIIEAARQSTGGSFRGWDSDARLLEYLYKHRHSTPFEMCELVVDVQAPIFVVREWQRHRTFSFNELSGRYVEMPPVYYAPGKGRMVRQATGNKQSSSSEALRLDIAEKMERDLFREQDAADAAYRDRLDHGLVREVARVNLPLSVYTRMRVKGNLRNWLHFLGLRLADNAQWEIRQYAEAIAAMVAEHWPRTWELFEEYDRYAVRLSRTEAKAWNEWKQSQASQTQTGSEPEPSGTSTS